MDVCSDLDDESYVDNVDYDGISYDLYFPYDYLENLGEVQQSPLKLASNGWYYPYAHGVFWLEHYVPIGSLQNSWLTYFGRFGTYWGAACGMYPIGQNILHASPYSPIMGQTHEWMEFTFETSQDGCGNTDASYVLGFANIKVSWVDDSAEGY